MTQTIEEGASHHAECGKNIEAFLMKSLDIIPGGGISYCYEAYPSGVYDLESKRSERARRKQ